MSKNLRIATFTAIAFMLFSILVYIFELWTHQYIDLFVSILVMLAAILSFSATLYNLSNYEKRDDQRPVWLCLSIGIGILLIAETIKVIYQISFQTVMPYPSWREYIGILSYIPFFTMFVLVVRRLGVKLSSQERTAIALFLFLGLAFFSVFLAKPILAHSSLEGYKQFLDLIVPIQDLVLLTCSVMIIMIFGSGRLRKPWLYLGLAILCSSLSDLALTVLLLSSLQTTPTSIELLWIAAYLLVGLGAISNGNVVSDALCEEKREEIKNEEIVKDEAVDELECTVV